MGINSTLKNLILQNPAVTKSILKTVRKAGFDIVNGPSAEVALLSNYGINLILDVGANVGQYATRTRTLGYEGRIISFEPIASVYAELANNAAPDLRWETFQLGLSNCDGEAVINVSEDSVYSSLMNSSALLSQKYDRSGYVAQETIKTAKLDSIFDRYCQPSDQTLLKIDVQGHEKYVLAGATAVLQHIKAIQLELSFVQHYEAEPLMMEMVEYLSTQGFTLIALSPLSHNLALGNLLQADGIFFRLA
jgi:FkbM family methyltransferase